MINLQGNEILTADEVRARFPKLVGPVSSGEVIDERRVLVDMGPKAIAVMVDGAFRACCKTRKRALAFLAVASFERPS
jgi:hypothetical protein